MNLVYLFRTLNIILFMDEIIIDYKKNKGQKILSIIVGAYIILFGGYHASTLAVDNTFDFNFYLAIAAIVLGIVLILKVTLFASKPVFRMNSEMIYSNVASKPVVFKTNWENIKNVAIGLSYLRITEIGGKEYNVDLGELKYADMKDIKSRIIEYCEAKLIAYQND